MLKSSVGKIVLICSFGLWLVACLGLQAATLTWDASTGDAVVTDGTGIWQVAVGNWWDGVADGAWTNGHDAVFGGGTNGSGTAGIVMLGSNVAPNSLTFNAPNAGTYTLDLAGYTNTLSTEFWAIDAKGDAAILDSVGTGAIVTPASNLRIVKGDGGTLTISAKITGTGSVSAHGAGGSGDVVLNNHSNDFVGLLYKQNGGRLLFDSVANSGESSSAGAGNELSIAHNAFFVYTGNGDTTDRTLTIGSGAGSYLENTGSGALVLTGAVNPTFDAAKILYVGGSNADENELRGVLRDNGAHVLSVIKQGDGVWMLSGTNTYSGTTTISDGILEVGSDTALGAVTGATVIASGATLRLPGGITTAEPVSVTGNGAQGGAIYSIGGSNMMTGLITLPGGGNRLQTAGAGTLTIAGGITSPVNEGPSFNGNFIVQDKPILVNSGGVGVTSATTAFNVGGHEWGAPFTLNFNGTARLGVTNALPTDTHIEFGWHTQGSSKGTLDLNGFDQTLASIAISSANPAFYRLGGDQNITGGGTLTINQTSTNKTYEYQGRITDGVTPTSLLKEGMGTQVLNNLSGTASSHSGATIVNAGILQAGGHNPFSGASPVRVNSNGIVRLDGYSVITGSLSGIGVVENAGSVKPLMSDDFTDGDILLDFRVYERLMDAGWIKQRINTSEWTISGGRLENASTNAATGYPGNGPAEAPVSQMFSNPGVNHPASFLTLTFDYTVGTGDLFYAHFWGGVGIVTNEDQFISNIEAGVNGAVNNTDSSEELTAYNMLDGASAKGSTASSISGLLTGTGRFTTTVDIASLGIPGVTTLADFDFFYLAFAKDETGTPGTTSVDNVQIRSELVSLALGADNADATFEGILQDGGSNTVSLAVTKIGAGTQTLVGTHAYTGPTMARDGTLAIAEGLLTLDGVGRLAIAQERGTLRVGDGGLLDVLNEGDVVVNSGGTVEVGNGGTLTLATNGYLIVNTDGLLEISGGTLSHDLGTHSVGPKSIFEGAGRVNVQAGALQVTNGPVTLALNQWGPIEISGGDVDIIAQLRVYNEIKVMGDEAAVDIGWLGADNPQASFVFALDSTGVSTINVSGWCALGSPITVDGSAYTGGDTNILLIDSTALVSTSSVVNITGFSTTPHREYDVSVVQDQTAGKDWVELIIRVHRGLFLVIR
jgi:fibronectin-binding autotransporter adhesin